MKLLLCLMVLWMPAAAFANGDDGTGPPLVCIGTDTFYPLGWRWCPTADKTTPTISLRFQQDGAPQADPIAIAPADSKAAVDQAFGVWLGVTCPAAQVAHPNLSFTVGADYPTKDAGDDRNAGTFNHVIWWDSNALLWDTSTIAVTTTTYTTAGFIVDADMMLDAVNFNWRTKNGAGAQFGCNASDANCYDIKSVALHEVGHFLGFGHASCADATMYPSENPGFFITTISHHEQAGMCAVYPPRASNAGTLGVMARLAPKQAIAARGLLASKAAGPRSRPRWAIAANPAARATIAPLVGYAAEPARRATFATPGCTLRGSLCKT